MKFLEKHMNKQTQQAKGSSSQIWAASKKPADEEEDVVDADYEVVDEDEKK